MNLYVMLVYAFFYRLYISVVFYTKYAMGQIKPVKKVPQMDYDKKYQKYVKHYKEAPDTEANTNICADLYDYDARKTLFTEEKNDTERLWKTRILYESTERGNILFYYNPYKLSFEYYSDAQIIPYSILQYVAKKYVSMNRCRDFYIDMIERPQNKMIVVLRKEEEAMKSKKMKVNDITKLVDKSLTNTDNVFESLKEHRTAATKGPVKEPAKGNVSKGPVKEPKEKLYPERPLGISTLRNADAFLKQPLEFANKYVRLGKISEFNITQKPPKKSITQTNEMLFSSKPINNMSDFFDDLEIEEEENLFLPPTSEATAEEPPNKEEKISSYKMFKNLKAASL
jgi:hypothetical protein